MKNVLVLLLLILIGCKTTFRANTNDTFRYEKFLFTDNPDSDSFKLSGFIYNSDGSPSTGNFSFDNQFPVYRFLTKEGYETAYITQSSPIHRTDSTGYFNFDFITNEDIALRFGFRCRETIKPQLGKHLNVIIYLNNDYMRQ